VNAQGSKVYGTFRSGAWVEGVGAEGFKLAAGDNAGKKKKKSVEDETSPVKQKSKRARVDETTSAKLAIGALNDSAAPGPKKSGESSKLTTFFSKKV